MFERIRKAREEETGFTLIELLVVIVILGILAAIVVFAVGGITDKGKQSACDTEKKTIQTAEEAYFASQKSSPTYDTTANLVAKHFLADTPVNYTVTSASSTSYTIAALSTSPNGCS